jgi:hypothetical protein
MFASTQSHLKECSLNAKPSSPLKTPKLDARISSTPTTKSIYDPAAVEFNENSGLAALSLIPIETEEEWNLVEQLLQDAAE